MTACCQLAMNAPNDTGSVGTLVYAWANCLMNCRVERRGRRSDESDLQRFVLQGRFIAGIKGVKSFFIGTLCLMVSNCSKFKGNYLLNSTI